MVNLKFNLKSALLSMLFLVFFPAFCSTLAGQTFDSNLKTISALQKSKKAAELLKKLESTRPSPELKDLHLFLQAEALKDLGRKSEAAKIYARILSDYPETEVAFQAMFTSFILQLDGADENSLSRLEGLAKSLTTPWRRGTALEKLEQLPFLKPGRRGRLALASIREFLSESQFYRTSDATHNLLKKILASPENYALDDDEWLEILLIARNEKVIGELFKKKDRDARIMGKWGQPAFDLFKAETLVIEKKMPQALTVYDAVLKNSRLMPQLKALTHQLRGDAFHFAERHSEALADYRQALQSPGFPVNETAALYRSMRSAFRLNRDAESLEILNRLVKIGNMGTLFPVHIFEMGLERYDAGEKSQCVPYFMLLSRYFPGHHRADDALGYSIKALGEKTEEGKTLLKLLKKKYPNSFFIKWVSPESVNEKLLLAHAPDKKPGKKLLARVAAMKKLWGTDYAGMARAEAFRLTEKYPRDLPLYRAIINIALDNSDYNQATAYAERLFRQTLEADKSLATLPEWAWKAHYPLAYDKEVTENASRFGIDKFWILSIMREESHFKKDTLSRSNAMGLMQILPPTGKWIADKLGEKKFHKDLLWQVPLNIRYGSWYLKFLSDMFKGDLYLASASYNGGQGNVLRRVEQGPHASMPVLERLDRIPLPETRDYFKKVMGSHWNYTRLYK